MTIAGRGVEALNAQPGQFFLWRFLSPELRGQQHPYSLSAAPRDRLRITVKNAGDGSALIADVRPGTTVLAEGPLGNFTHAARTRRGLLLVAAGIGITPVRALLEDPLLESSVEAEQVTVVIRVRSREHAPLLDEVEKLAAERGVQLHLVLGSRGATWGSSSRDVSVTDFVDDPRDIDLFICGPRDWAGLVTADARAAGVDENAIRYEEFGW